MLPDLVSLTTLQQQRHSNGVFTTATIQTATGAPSKPTSRQVQPSTVCGTIDEVHVMHPCNVLTHDARLLSRPLLNSICVLLRRYIYLLRENFLVSQEQVLSYQVRIQG
jgi:hypothetical protein